MNKLKELEALKEQFKTAIEHRKKVVEYTQETVEILKDFNSGKMNEDTFKKRLEEISNKSEKLHSEILEKIKGVIPPTKKD